MSDQLPSNFTPRAQQAVALARKEAIRLRHTYVGTEHILLGIIKLGQGVAWNVIRRLGFNIETFSLEMEKKVGPCCYTRGFVPNTDNVEKIFGFATKEAKALGHTYVGTEHLLLGIFEEGHGLAARVLRDYGLTDITAVRVAVLSELDPNYKPKEALKPIEESREGGFDHKIKELGDQFVADLVAEVSKQPMREESPFQVPNEMWTFLFIDFLLATGYTFNGITLEVAIVLNSGAKTLERLNTVCRIIRRRWVGDDFREFVERLQREYDRTSEKSVTEENLGRLLQMLTSKLPQKLSPGVDWLKISGFVTGQPATNGGAESSVPPESAEPSL